jgi:hypothetical protein
MPILTVLTDEGIGSTADVGPPRAGMGVGEGRTMKPWILALAACACEGCTMMSLERHTLAQTESAIDLRYREIMDNLAMVACDPASLPAYSSIFAGTIQITDQQQLVSTTAWQHVISKPIQDGFSSEAMNPVVSRTVFQNWTLDPIVVPEKLEAMRACCQWAIGGPEHVYPDSMSLLISPDKAPAGSARHFDVADKLERLPPGWLHVGCLKDVPGCALYKAHCGGTWVWVMPEGIKGLADFSLIIQNIARVYSNSPTLFNLPPAYLPTRFQTADSPIIENKNDPKSRQVRMTAMVYVDQGGHLIPDVPYCPVRIDNVSVDSHVKSQINAAAVATPH